ncbi:MAG: response regulator [Anaerolineaceae bacterium]|nr:response regulator [Anaerolineaceae bacterium]
MVQRVLVVHKGLNAAQVLTNFFEERGYEVWHTSKIDEAQALVDLVRPNLMVLDLHLPGNDWLRLLEHVRQEYPGMKVIMTNATPDVHREFLAQQRGVKIFLRQPFTKRWLQRALERVETSEAVEPSMKPHPYIFIPLRIRVILPYLLLFLVLTLGGGYFTRQIVKDSLQENFQSNLLETGHQYEIRIAELENFLTLSLHSVANTPGLVESLETGDVELLGDLISQDLFLYDIEALEILDTEGVSLSSLRLKSEREELVWEKSSGEPFLRTVDFVNQLLLGDPEMQEWTPSGLVQAPWGDYYYAGMPLFGTEDQLLGLVMVGLSVNSLINQLSNETKTKISFYDLTGQLLDSSLTISSKDLAISYSQVKKVISGSVEENFARKFTLTKYSFLELLVPWQSSSGENLGLLGISMKEDLQMFLSPTNELQLIVLFAAAVIFIIMIGLYLSNGVTALLQKIITASREVVHGNLDVKVKTKRSDELGAFVKTFNYMIVGFQEYLINHDLFGFSSLLGRGDRGCQSLAVTDLHLQDQETTAAIMVTDIQNFDQVFYQAPSDKVFSWLNDYYNQIVPIVIDSDGVVEKFDGSLMKVYFGLFPRMLPATESAMGACNAALKVIMAIDGLNRLRSKLDLLPMEVTVVIDTGSVSAGMLDIKNRLHFSIFGRPGIKTRQLYSCLRGIAVPGGIFITSSTYQALGDYQKQFTIELLEQEGFSEECIGVEIYRLLPLKRRS